MWLIR